MTASEVAPSAPPMLRLQGHEAPWCVDGRPDFASEKGPQMLGGSIHPILLSAIYHKVDFDENIVLHGIRSLKDAGKRVGVHRGAHRHLTREMYVDFFDLDTKQMDTATDEDYSKWEKFIEPFHREERLLPFNAKMDQRTGTSDCGFADRPDEVIAKALDKRKEITRRLIATYEANSQIFGDLLFVDIIAEAYMSLEAWDLAKRKVRISGEDLISTFEAQGSNTVDVQGDHGEQHALVNTAEGETYDTNMANREGHGDFNLDLPEAVDQSRILGVPSDISLGLSLILYQATEMVLVEDKGKESLPIVVYSNT